MTAVYLTARWKTKASRFNDDDGQNGLEEQGEEHVDSEYQAVAVGPDLFGNLVTARKRYIEKKRNKMKRKNRNHHFC